MAYVFTRDLKRALRVVERLETGMVGLNQGMVSNAGRAVRRHQAVRLRPRGRPEGIEEYLETKYVAINL